jgi:ribosomal protein S18 acetylase RimI-like enzyme
MTATPLCEHLEWDTKFFGVRVGRIVPTTVTVPELSRVRAWVAAEKIDCLYFLCGAEEICASALVQESGFLLTDIRLTFETTVKAPAEPVAADAGGIREATSADVTSLKAIARTSHQLTRFHADPHFSLRQCEALYETWIQKSCEGFADVVLVATAPNGAVVGYVSCHAPGKSEGKIGLIAVAPQARRAGWSRLLLGAALNWFAAQGCATVTVVTQGSNVGAQRLYQRFGFLTRSVQLWFHHWPARESG